MKHIFLVLVSLLTLSTQAQPPEKMSYQAVIRDKENNLLTNSKIGLQISILQGATTGKAVYTETQSTVTNQNGLLAVEIGTGTTNDHFADISWDGGAYFIQTDIDPEGSNNYTLSAVSEILSVPYAMYAEMAGGVKGWDQSENGVSINSGHLGIGTEASDEYALEVEGTAVFNGNVKVAGKLLYDSIDINQITGLLGQGLSAYFPDVVDNKIAMEISGVFSGDAVMTSSVAIETERISTPIGVDANGNIRHREDAGFSMEVPVSFEVFETSLTSQVKAWFDSKEMVAKDISMVIPNLSGDEAGRISLFGYIPDRYEPGIDGRTRFYIKANAVPDNVLSIDFVDPFWNEHSYNPATDKLVEIEGITTGNSCPAVEIDTLKRTLTLTFDYLEGNGMYLWSKNTVLGLAKPISISVIETTNGTSDTEISRMNYFYCIPIRYDILSGFGLDNKLKARLIVAYGFREDG